jgi:hypothetical protein
MYKYRLTFAMTSGHVTSPSQNAPRGQGAQVHSPEHQSQQEALVFILVIAPNIKSKPTCQNTYFHSMVLKVIKRAQPTWHHQARTGIGQRAVKEGLVVAPTGQLPRRADPTGELLKIVRVERDLEISKIEKRVSVDHARNCIQT